MCQELIKEWKKTDFRPKIPNTLCYAPCSTYVIEYLSNLVTLQYFFKFWYSSKRKNIYKTYACTKDFVEEFNKRNEKKDKILADEYAPSKFIRW